MWRDSPASPCTRLCVLGADGLCSGCLRSADEIAAWHYASDAHKRAILRLLEQRRAQRGATEFT